MAKKLKVGLDFDGVLVYNPLRVARHPVTLFKRLVLGQKKTRFFIPKTDLQKQIWALAHESSILPARGLALTRELIKGKKIEAYLISGRFSYLEPSLRRWLTKHNVEDLFTRIEVNRRDEQPHFFKERLLKELNLDVFIEDNLDIVEHLHGGKTKVYWIYNLLDLFHPYPRKHPHLHSALEAMIKDFRI